MAFCAAAGAAPAQTSGRAVAADARPVDAILVEGPVYARGIDAIAPDLTPNWRARYRVGEAVVDLHYVVGALPGPAAWTPIACTLRAIRGSGDGRFYYQQGSSWSLLLVASEGELVCGFVDRFVEGYNFFMSVPRPGTGVPSVTATPSESTPPPDFPALLELPAR